MVELVGYGLDRMCGRYVSASSPQEIADYFGATVIGETLVEPNYNVAPTTQVPVIRERPARRSSDDADRTEGDQRWLDLVRWGLIPSWAKSKNIGAKMINARIETVTTKNAFRAAVKRRRCIVPADAFYEWTAIPHPDGAKPAKQPWCIKRADGDMFAFAGLYEVWRDPEAGDDAEPIVSCTVLTREANEAMSAIHDRMPVMLQPDLWGPWLDRTNDDVDGLLAAIPPVPDELLTIHPVSTAVNNSRSRGAQLLDEVEPMTEHPAVAEAGSGS